MVTHISKLIFILSIIAGTVQAQWLQSDGVEGGQIIDLMADGNVLYAATKYDVFRSTDNASTWQALNTHANASILAVAASENAIVVATALGLLRSADNGVTWDEVTNIPASFIDIKDVTDLLFAGKNVFATTTSGNTYVSADDGFSWTLAKAGKTNRLTRLFATKTHLFGGGYITNAIYRTNASGTDPWAPMRYDGTVVNGFATAGGALFASAEIGYVFKSTDDGTTWTPVDSGLAVHATVQAIAAVKDSLYLATYSGIYKSSNGGESWRQISPIASNTMIGRSMTTIGNDIFIGTEEGVFASKNEGYNWMASNFGLTATNVVTLLDAGAGQLFCGTQANGVFRSVDGGSSWIPYSGGMPRRAYRINALEKIGNRILAGGSDGIYELDDSGLWNKLSTPLDETYALSNINGKLYASEFGKVFRSDDNGDSWTDISMGLTGNNTVIHGFVLVGTTVFATSYVNAGGVYTMQEGEGQWTTLLTNPPAAIIYLINKGDTLYAATYDGVFRSPDKGNSWTPFNTGLSDYYSLLCSTIAADNNHLYVGTQGGVYITAIDTEYWYPFNSGFSYPKMQVKSFLLHDNKLLAGTEASGVWTTDADVVIAGISADEKNVVTVYPNPVSDNLRIKLTPTDPSKRTEITIRDSRGRKLQSQVVKDTTEFTMNVNDYPVGIYILQVVQGKKITQTKFVKY